MLVLDFNDIALTVFDEKGVLAQSPGYAVLEANHFLLGEAAKAKSRLNPRASFHDFWQQLEQQPLNRPAGPAQSRADIAYYHLNSLWQQVGDKREPVLLLVPAQYGSERVALLLGIAQACGIRVAGISETALVASAGAASLQATGAQNESLSVRYLDISQHRLYCTDVNGGEDLVLDKARELKTQGLNACLEQCIHRVAEQFLAETRFDPLHEAASEQRLFDHLPQVFEKLSIQEYAGFSLPAGQREHRIEWPREQLLAALEPIYRELEGAVQDWAGQVLVSHRLAQLPFLIERLSQYGPCEVVTQKRVIENAYSYSDQLQSEAASPVWVKRLKQITQIEKAGAASSELAVSIGIPTHFLVQHRAFAFNQNNTQPKVLLRDGVPFIEPVAGLQVNGEVIAEEQRLQLGDRLRHAGEDYLLIRVEAE